MPEVHLRPLPFEAAIAFFNDKGFRLSPDSFRDVWSREHVQAFTVARVTAMDVLEDIASEVGKAVSHGVPLTKFKAGLRSTLERKGWFSPTGERAEIPMPDGTIRKRLTPWRLDTIYRTNLQSAYQAGRFRGMLDTAEARPYWVYDAVGDMRTRPSHAALDGKVYRFDHPFWDKFYPPNGYNCRCTVRTLSEKQMTEKGLQEQIQPPFVKPDEGFDYNAGAIKWQPDPVKFSPEGRRFLEGLPGLPPRNLSQMSANLNLMRDGFAGAGVPATTAPIRITRDTRTRHNAWANYETGEIGIRADLADEISTALARGSATTQKQVDAFKTLVHEMGHQLGLPIDLYRYGSDHAYKALAQTVNDLWARLSLGEMLRSTGLKYDLSKVRNVLRFHPTGYQPYVERAREIFKTAGFSTVEQKALLDRLNLTVSPEDYSTEMWRAIRTKKPRVTETGSFGNVLLQERQFNQLMRELGV